MQLQSRWEETYQGCGSLGREEESSFESSLFTSPWSLHYQEGFQLFRGKVVLDESLLPQFAHRRWTLGCLIFWAQPFIILGQRELGTQPAQAWDYLVSLTSCPHAKVPSASLTQAESK